MFKRDYYGSGVLLDAGNPEEKALHKEGESLLKSYKKNLEAFYDELPEIGEEAKRWMAMEYAKGLKKDMQKYPGDIQVQFLEMIERLRSDFKISAAELSNGKKNS